MKQINTEPNRRIGEVIEATAAGFTAQCYELYEMPPLGSLVKSGDGYGIVGDAFTTGIEPGRRPIARGKDEASEEAVYQASPQLLKLLRSEFTVAAIGCKADGRICHYLPPYPARIHGFVYLCQPDEIREFSREFGFLDILINATLPLPTDEIISAALRQMSRAHEDNHAFLVAAGKELAARLSQDYNRLKSILGRLK